MSEAQPIPGQRTGDVEPVVENEPVEMAAPPPPPRPRPLPMAAQIFATPVEFDPVRLPLPVAEAVPPAVPEQYLPKAQEEPSPPPQEERPPADLAEVVQPEAESSSDPAPTDPPPAPRPDITEFFLRDLQDLRAATSASDLAAASDVNEQLAAMPLPKPSRADRRAERRRAKAEEKQEAARAKADAKEASARAKIDAEEAAAAAKAAAREAKAATKAARRTAAEPEPSTGPEPVEEPVDELPVDELPVGEPAVDEPAYDEPPPLHLEDLFGEPEEAPEQPEQPATQETAQETAAPKPRNRRKGKRRNAREMRALAAGADEIAAVDTEADLAAVELTDVPADEQAEVLDPPDEPEDTLPSDRIAYVAAPHVPRRRKPKPAGRRRRVVNVALLLVLLGGAAAAPWLVPGLRDLLASSVPEDAVGGSHVRDPKVEPAKGFVGPVGVKQASGPYAGVQLASAGRPLEVDVPRLHVKSDVVAISGQSGELTPPDDPQVLGWWQEGRVAGAQFGSAVVTGHTVHTGGGAFDHLAELVPGDTIRVRTGTGWIQYVVRRSRIYSVAGLAKNSEDIFRPGGDGRLVLITCDDWNGEEYLSNAVVYAVPVKDQPFSGPPAAPTSTVVRATQVPDAGPSPAG